MVLDTEGEGIMTCRNMGNHNDIDSAKIFTHTTVRTPNLGRSSLLYMDRMYMVFLCEHVSRTASEYRTVVLKLSLSTYN